MDRRGRRGNGESYTSRVPHDHHGKENTTRNLCGSYRRVTCIESQALIATTFFHGQILTIIHKDIDTINNELWDKAEDTLVEEIMVDIEYWDMKPCTVMGHASAYEHMMMSYCVMKNLL